MCKTPSPIAILYLLDLCMCTPLNLGTLYLTAKSFNSSTKTEIAVKPLSLILDALNLSPYFTPPPNLGINEPSLFLDHLSS